MFVKHKLNIKPSKKPIQQLVQIQDMEYTFRESMPKSNFYNESILNSSKEIPFYETKMIPFLKESKVSINGEKNKNLLEIEKEQFAKMCWDQIQSVQLEITQPLGYWL